MVAEEPDHTPTESRAPEPGPLAPAVPAYFGIRLGAVVLWVMTGLAWAASLVLFFLWLSDTRELSYLWMSASGFAYGSILWMLASIGLAVKDIAENSFKKI